MSAESFMSNGKRGASTSHSNRVWKHTKNAPTAFRSQGKWSLGVGYCTKISARKQSKRKTSCDQEFSASFGRVGLYETQEAAEKDTDRFRMAVDFGTERAGRGGYHKQTTGDSGGGAIRASPIKRQRTCPGDDPMKRLDCMMGDVRKCAAAVMWKVERLLWRTKHNEKLRKRGVDPKAHTCNTRIKTARHKRMDKFSRMNAARQREENKDYQRVRACDVRQLQQVEWAMWREQVLAHLNKHIHSDSSGGSSSSSGGAESGSPHAASFALVERMVRESKIHRCILNQETRYLRDSIGYGVT